MNGQLVTVQLQDYLPIKYLKLVYQQNWRDDIIEPSKKFDPYINFWEPHKVKLNPIGEDPIVWHDL